MVGPGRTKKMIPFPLGGAPSIITDKQGDGTLERDLNFCPVDAASDGVDVKRLAEIGAVDWVGLQ